MKTIILNPDERPRIENVNYASLRGQAFKHFGDGMMLVFEPGEQKLNFLWENKQVVGPVRFVGNGWNDLTPKQVAQLKGLFEI